MNKQELVATLAIESNVNKVEAERRLDAVLTVITKALEVNGEAILTGIGKLKIVTRKARSGRNPNNGSVLQIPAKKVVKFRTSSLLEI
jgi:DNA-binding protein HU-beta